MQFLAWRTGTSRRQDRFGTLDQMRCLPAFQRHQIKLAVSHNALYSQPALLSHFNQLVSMTVLQCVAQ